MEGKRACLVFNLDLQVFAECWLESPRQSVQLLPDKSVETLPEKQQTSQSASLVLTFVVDIYYLSFSPVCNVILDKKCEPIGDANAKRRTCAHAFVLTVVYEMGFQANLEGFQANSKLTQLSCFS